MVARSVPDEVLREAVQLVAKHGSAYRASIVTGTPSGTLTARCHMAARRGIFASTPAARPVDEPPPSQLRPMLDPPEAYVQLPAGTKVPVTLRSDSGRPRKRGRTHLVIPDVQAKDGVPNDHLEWIANYAIVHRPDVVIQIGDWFDMPSLSSYDKGKRSYEGRRYVLDIDAGRASIERFERVIDDYNRAHPEDPYDPDREVTGGNHEQRAERAADIDPMLHGKVGIADMGFEDYGWNYHQFLDVVEIDGVQYSHYFTSGSMGRPVSSARALLWEAGGRSATMGHVQHTDIHIHKKSLQTGLFCGICYLHDEHYLGAQGNSTRRQIIMKHEVQDGLYDIEFVSLESLRKNYS